MQLNYVVDKYLYEQRNISTINRLNKTQYLPIFTL